MKDDRIYFHFSVKDLGLEGIDKLNPKEMDALKKHIKKEIDSLDKEIQKDESLKK